VDESDETRRGVPAAGFSPTDRRAPSGDHQDDDENDLVSAVEDLVNDLAPLGDHHSCNTMSG
jgi:hypothetical protein